MALVNISNIIFPNTTTGMQANASDTSTFLQLDASGEKIGCIIKIQKSGTLHKVHFCTGTVVQDQTLRVSFQNVDLADGNPDDTQDQYRDVAILGTDDGIWFTTGILSSDGTDTGTKRSVSAGDTVAVVFEITDFAASDIFRLRAFTCFISQSQYSTLYTGTWAKSTTIFPAIILEYSDGTLVPNAEWPVFLNVGAISLASTTNPVRQGIKCVLPFKCKIIGFRYLGTSPSGSEPSMALYQSDGKTLDTACNPTNEDGDITASTSAISSNIFCLSTPKTMEKDTTFYVYCFNNTTTAFSLRYASYNAASYKYVREGMFTTLELATQHSTNDPTVTATQAAAIQIVISEIDDGTGSGGSGNNANMGQFNGGFN